MKYRCENCNWVGKWDSLIHETTCPVCKSTTLPVRDNGPILSDHVEVSPHFADRQQNALGGSSS